jgi:hypothetical protein
MHEVPGPWGLQHAAVMVSWTFRQHLRCTASTAPPVVLLQQGSNLGVLVLQRPAVDLGGVRRQHNLHYLHGTTHPCSVTALPPCSSWSPVARLPEGLSFSCSHVCMVPTSTRSLQPTAAPAAQHQADLPTACTCIHLPTSASLAPTWVDTASNTSSGSMPSATRRSNTSAQLLGFFSSARARRTLQPRHGYTADSLP